MESSGGLAAELSASGVRDVPAAIAALASSGIHDKNDFKALDAKLLNELDEHFRMSHVTIGDRGKLRLFGRMHMLASSGSVARDSVGSIGRHTGPPVQGASTAEMKKAWNARVSESGKYCPICQKFYASRHGFCSVCWDLVEEFFGTTASKELVFSSVSVEAMTSALADTLTEKQRVANQNYTSLVRNLDEAVQPVIMPSPILAHILRNIKVDITHRQVAGMLLDSGHPLLSAAQATKILDKLRQAGSCDYKFYHVLCTRVVDRWNLDPNLHGIGHCYFGYEDKDAVKRDASKLVHSRSQDTLVAALTSICRNSGVTRRQGSQAEDPSSLWDQQMDQHVGKLMRCHGAIRLGEQCVSHRDRRESRSRSPRNV